MNAQTEEDKIKDVAPVYLKGGGQSGLLRVSCPYCNTTHIHGLLGGYRLCGSCGNKYYIIDPINQEEMDIDLALYFPKEKE